MKFILVILLLIGIRCFLEIMGLTESVTIQKQSYFTSELNEGDVTHTVQDYRCEFMTSRRQYSFSLTRNYFASLAVQYSRIFILNSQSLGI